MLFPPQSSSPLAFTAPNCAATTATDTLVFSFNIVASPAIYGWVLVCTASAPDPELQREPSAPVEDLREGLRSPSQEQIFSGLPWALVKGCNLSYHNTEGMKFKLP